MKQPSDEVGPYQLLHDESAGHLAIDFQVDLLELVKLSGVDGLTAKDAAAAITGKDRPTAADVEKARRRLDQKATEGLLVRLGGGRGRGSTAAWFLADQEITRKSRGAENRRSENHAGFASNGNHAEITQITQITLDGEAAGQKITPSNHGNHGAGNHVFPHPFRDGETGRALSEARNGPPAPHRPGRPPTRQRCLPAMRRPPLGAGGRYRELPAQDHRRSIHDRQHAKEGAPMRLRHRKFHAKVILQVGEWPVLVCLGPGLTFEMQPYEARQLALDIADALEQLHRGGGEC